MPDHEEQRRLKNGLLTMGNLPSAPADPMPAISRRINRRRKVRYTVSGIALAACAALVATTVVPALGGGARTIEPAASSTPTLEPTPSRRQGGPGSVGSAEFMAGGLRVGSQVHGVGFEEFTAGRNGPAYVVMSGAGVAAVSYRENGTGRPCLAAIGLDEARPRFCLDGELSGTQIRSSKVEIPFDVGGDRLVLMFARPEVHDIELVAKTGETMSRSNVVKTKTSNDVRFSAYWYQDDRVVVGEIVGHRSAGEPNEGTSPPKNAGGYSSVVRVSGPGFEQFVPGQQGVGYDLSELAQPGVAVTHKLNGTGEPCITIAKLAKPERVCFTGWKPGQRIQPTIEPLADGRVLVVGFAKLDVARVEIVGHDAAETALRDTVATPTTQNLSFFACMFEKTDMQPVEVRVEK